VVLDRRALVEEFGRAVSQHKAVVFVGAGLSMAAGYPDWDGLIKTIRSNAKVPPAITDAPLAAEYAAAELGREQFEKKLLLKLSSVTPALSKTMSYLAALPVAEYWTTNFDNLLESALPSPFVRLTDDKDYAGARNADATKRLTKMHGSLSLEPGPSQSWESSPVITRGDFERYEFNHPLMSAQLRAQFLTSSFLFMGLSFNDPNVDVLLKISRSLPEDLDRPPHFAILREEKSPAKRRAYELKVRDLENSGIRVCLVNEFTELEEIAEELVRRSKRPNLFVGGSRLDDRGKQTSEAIGSRLNELGTELAIISFAGEAALAVSDGFWTSMIHGEYSPERIRFYFRAHGGKAAPKHPKRMGSCIYTHLDLDAMRSEVLAEARAFLVIGGGSVTDQEVQMALSIGIPVIPVAIGDGLGKLLWESRAPANLGLNDFVDAALWERLGSLDPNVVSRAVEEAVGKCMFLT
jgi:hypothetical protein